MVVFGLQLQLQVGADEKTGRLPTKILHNIWSNICVPLQCGARLQAAGGQAAATNEEALPYRRHPLRPPVLSPGGLHLHPKTQVQTWLQEACSLETLVSVKTQDCLLFFCTGLIRPSCCQVLAHHFLGFVFFQVTSVRLFVDPVISSNGELHHWILNPFPEMTGCVMGHKCGFHGKFKMSSLPKWIQSYFEHIPSKRVWNYTSATYLEISKVRRQNFIFLCLFAYIFLADIYRVLFCNNGSVTVTFLFTSWDFVYLPSLQERLAIQPRCSEVYINSISPYCKAQLTLFRIHLLQNNGNELFWVLTHTCRSSINIPEWRLS